MSRIDPEAMAAQARRAAGVLRALANEHRLLILCQLAGGERAVGELVAAVGLSQSAVSQHLARLRADGLVSTRRERQTIHYALASPEIRRVIATLYDLYCRGALRCGAARAPADPTSPTPHRRRT